MKFLNEIDGADKLKQDSNNRLVTDEEKQEWNNKAEISDIPTKVGQLENDKNYITQVELDNAGYGDMLKSVYDTDNDGKVDMAKAADSVPWNGVTGKPGTFPPSSHSHSTVSISDIKANATNQDADEITISGFYHCNVNVPTVDGENDKAVIHNQYGGSSYWATQIAISWRNGRMWFRNKENGTWEAWQEIAKISDIPSSLPANGGNADTVDNKHVDDTKTDTTALWTAGKIIAYVGSAGYGNVSKVEFDEHLADYALFKNGAFELWASRSTNTYKTIFDSPTAGDITEEIRNTISNDLVASKVTEFDTPTVGQISETLHIVEDNVTVTKITTFDPDGSISEVIT